MTQRQKDTETQRLKQEKTKRHDNKQSKLQKVKVKKTPSRHSHFYALRALCIMIFYKCLPIVFVSKSEEYQGDVWGVLVVSKGFWTGLGNGDV